VLVQQEDSQINRRLFSLSPCRMKKTMPISASLSIPIDTKVGNDEHDPATTENYRIALLSSSTHSSSGQALVYILIALSPTLSISSAWRRRLDGLGGMALCILRRFYSHGSSFEQQQEGISDSDGFHRRINSKQ
jgi:hypothetical protein